MDHGPSCKTIKELKEKTEEILCFWECDEKFRFDIQSKIHKKKNYNVASSKLKMFAL